MLKGETLLGGFGEALRSCGELAEERGRVEGGEGGGWEPWRHGDAYVCMAPNWEGLRGPTKGESMNGTSWDSWLWSDLEVQRPGIVNISREGGS